MTKKISYAILLCAAVFTPFSMNATETTADTVSVQQNAAVDSAAAAGLSAEDIRIVLGVFDGNPVKDVIPRVDMLMRTAKSPEQASSMAEAIYDYYKSSHIMGYDEIAIYVADNYFLNGKVKCADADKYMMMKIFAESNRQSLVGFPVPSLTLPDMAGENVSLRDCKGDYKILVFYEDDCPSCRRQLPVLMKYLEGVVSFKVTLYRVYTQSDREKWVNWVAASNSEYKTPASVNVVDVWDPDFTSDFSKKFGVLSTPQIFLIDRHNTIIGRALSAKAVEQLIEIYNDQPGKYDVVFDPIFQPIVKVQGEVDMEKVYAAVDQFYEDSKDNPEFFHESMFYLYQYLKVQNSYDLQKGAAYLAEKYIVEMPAMWEGVTFTDEGETSGSVLRADYNTVGEFIDASKEAVRRFNLNQLNTKVTDLKLTTSENKKFNICSTKSAYTVLYFYSPDCAACQASSADMKKLAEKYAERDVTFLAIYTGHDIKWPESVSSVTDKWVELWDKKGKSGMFTSFDLDGLPRIYLLDEKHNVMGKDLNPAILENILDYLK